MNPFQADWQNDEFLENMGLGKRETPAANQSSQPMSAPPMGAGGQGSPGDTITINMVSASGGGFMRRVTAPKGIRVRDFVLQHGGVAADTIGSYKIRVNREHTTDQQVLNDGDKVVMSVAKMEGAYPLAA